MTVPHQTYVCSVRAGDRYQYYRTRVQPVATRQPQPGLVGLALSEALPLLPDDAVYIGEGMHAQGTVVAAAILATGLVRLAVIGTLAWLVYRCLR